MNMSAELRAIEPMLASPSKVADRDTLLSSQAFVFDFKWDGIRALIFVEDGAVTIRTREGIDVTARYPELAGYAARNGRDMVLDGEIVVMDPQLQRFSFNAALRRNSLTRANAIAAAVIRLPATFVAFDLLWLDGQDLRGEPLNRRLGTLSQVEVGAFHVSSSTGDGHAAWRAVEQFGMEGLVAKRWKSRYWAGRRSDEWIKIKRLKRVTAIVSGYIPGRGDREDQVGALVLSLLDGDKLVRIGKVGTGFKRSDHGPMLTVLREGHEFLVEVEYMEATLDNQLRHPSFKGIRTDITRDDCTVAQIERR